MPKIARGKVAALVIAAFMGDAVAQTPEDRRSVVAPSTTTPETTNVFELPAVLVTVQKILQSLGDVPVSVTAFTAPQIRDAGISDVTDLTQRAPNFFQLKTGARGHTTTLTMRGVTSANADFANPTVGLFVDGVSIGGGYDQDFFDVERVEILRGPQATLYGPGTLGGAVNIISKRPDFKWDTEADFTAGSFRRFQERAAFGGPITDNLAFRLTATKLNSGGYVRNTVLNESGETRDDFSLRGQVRVRIGPRLDVNLNLNGFRYSGRFAAYAPISQIDRDHFKVTADFPGKAQQDAFGQILTATYTADDFVVTSITGHRYWRSSESLDADYTDANLARDRSYKSNNQFSQEIRVSSPAEKRRFTWVAGLYLSAEDQTTGDDFTFNPPLFGVLSPTTSSGRVNVKAYNYAVFGQASYELFDGFSLSAGLRYDAVTKKLAAESATITTSAVFPGPSLAGKETFGAFLPRFSVSYRWLPELMTYGTISRGYKPGGFQTFNPTRANFPYRSEYSWNYEIGLKSSLFGERVQINASLFYIDIREQQFSTLVAPNVAVLSNIGRSHSKGFEIEAIGRVAPGLTMFGSIGLTDARVDRLDGNTTGTFVGARPSHVPEYTATIGAQYRAPFGLFARIENNFIGRYFLDGNNRVRQAPFSLLSVRIGYEHGPFSIYGYGTNLLNEKYLTRAFGGTLPNQGFVAREGEALALGVAARLQF